MRPLSAVLLAISLAASACGASSTAADAPAIPRGSADAGDAAPAEADDMASVDDEEDPATEENLFPDIAVLDVQTGDSVNLAAQLGGGDTPVLLWFWAPH
ncbi:MAG: hypothetical protein ACI8TP_001909 [Acidimicrobiales bacterium]|jgi:hypothetical protein